jgi:hypothetical protein
MIGVLATPEQRRAVEEFFELFKTEWEFCAPGRRYDLVLASTRDLPSNLSTKTLVLYNSGRTAIDSATDDFTAEALPGGQWLCWNGIEFPVYGNIASLSEIEKPFLVGKEKGVPVGGGLRSGKCSVVRVGYDLLDEVAFLLSHGQPSQNAHVPTLDIHIELLRTIMKQLAIPFVEVAASPAGYDFMACLTHDVDFVNITDHKLDHTTWGFLYRAFIGSFRRVLTKKLTWSRCWQNWKAGISLPFVYLGMAEDFWLEFDRYLEIEKGLGSTLFFIPFKGRAGTAAPRRRAAKYDLENIKQQVDDLLSKGCEIGLHGIDSWSSKDCAQAEIRRICEISGQPVAGIRMHWLYWNDGTPKALEGAGISYDSTFGYNDAVGFRAGTTQAFCPLATTTLIELPLNIQDTAMFYSGRMELSEDQAFAVCQSVLRAYRRYGGVLTINWHTRSLSPERLWGEFYLRLLTEVRKDRVWFGTAQQMATWFRCRRALRFESVNFSDAGVTVRLSASAAASNVPFSIRVYAPHPQNSEAGACEVRCAIEPNTDFVWNCEQKLV